MASVVRFLAVAARFGVVRFGVVRFGVVRFGVVRFGVVRFGVVRFGVVRFGVPFEFGPDYRLKYFITFACYGARLHGDESGSVDPRHNLVGGPRVEPDSQRVLAERREMLRILMRSTK